MSKKLVLFTLAVAMVAPAFAAQSTPVPAAGNVEKTAKAAPVDPASAPAALSVAQPDRKTADDYAPLARNVYFGGR